jgi:hypothetical protein
MKNDQRDLIWAKLPPCHGALAGARRCSAAEKKRQKGIDRHERLL